MAEESFWPRIGTCAETADVGAEGYKWQETWCRRRMYGRNVIVPLASDQSLSINGSVMEFSPNETPGWPVKHVEPVTPCKQSDKHSKEINHFCFLLTGSVTNNEKY